jgi:hypothetical protein
MTATFDIRKIVTLRDVTYAELGHKPARPIVRAVGMAVIHNPYAGKYAEDLRQLWEAGAELGERLTPELVKMLDAPPVSYGKGAIVGVQGETEHGGACCHPMLGKPMRAAVGGGQALGASIDIPIGHKDEAWSFAHFDTITVSIADSPRPHEILVAIVVADGGRLDNRCGTEPIR